MKTVAPIIRHIWHESALALAGGAESGGAGFAALWESIALSQLGVKSRLFTPSPYMHEQVELPPSIVCIPTFLPQGATNDELYQYFSTPEFLGHIKSHLPPNHTIFISDYYATVGGMMELIKDKPKKKWIYRSHSAFSRVEKLFMPGRDISQIRQQADIAALHCADALIFSTEAEKKLTLQTYKDLSPNLEAKMHVVPLAVDRALFSPEERIRQRSRARQKYLPKIKEETIVISIVGRIDPEKNTLWGIQMFHKFLNIAKTAPVHLAVVGGTSRGGISYKQEIDAYLRSTPELLPNITFTDVVPPTEAYALTDVIFHPSCYETFGLSLLESAACGLPILVHDVPMIRETLDGGPLYFTLNQEQTVLAALTQSLDPTWRTRAGEQNAARSAQFTWEKNAQNILKVLEQV